MTRKRKVSLLLGGVALLLALFVAGYVVGFRVMGYTGRPEQAKFVYADLVNFENAHEHLGAAANAQDSLAVLDAYLSQGTSGLNEFGSEYKLDAESLLRAIRERPNYYASLRDVVERVKAHEEATRAAFIRLEELYPEAVFPPVYYFIAHNRAGGSVSRAGVRIAVEVYALTENTDWSEFPSGPGSRHPMTDLPHLVVHELVHANQFLASPIGYTRNWDNRARAIKEGTADFIAELASGGHINEKAHEYGLAHESALWTEYRQVLDSHDTGEWFWYPPKKGERPQDLGYFVGYRIAKSLYERTPDKSKAVTRLIRSADYEALLADSGYQP